MHRLHVPFYIRASSEIVVTKKGSEAKRRENSRCVVGRSGRSGNTWNNLGWYRNCQWQVLKPLNSFAWGDSDPQLYLTFESTFASSRKWRRHYYIQGMKNTLISQVQKEPTTTISWRMAGTPNGKVLSWELRFENCGRSKALSVIQELLKDRKLIWHQMAQNKNDRMRLCYGL